MVAIVTLMCVYTCLSNSIITGAFTFINGTPKAVLSGTTYSLLVQFSPGNGGTYDCYLRELGILAKLRQPCNSFRTEFTDLKRGEKYSVKVIRLSGSVREVISDEIVIPT